MSVVSILPEALPLRGEPLDDAYQRLVEACQSASLSVHIPELANAQSPLKGFVRYFHVAGQTFDPGLYCMVFVATEPWSHDKAVLFLNTYLNLLLDRGLRQQIGRPVFLFRSAYPLHPMLEYIFEDWDAGRFEAMALVHTSKQALDEQNVSMLAVAGRDLVAEVLDFRLDLDNIDTIGEINDLILGELRTCEDTNLAIQPEDYRPQGILSMLGAMLGEVIRRHHPDKVRWTMPPESLGGTFPVLEMAVEHPDHEEACYIFPIDRLHHCYQEGQDRDLRTYYEVVIAHALEGQDDGLEEATSFEAVSEKIFPVLKPTDWNARMDIESIALLAEGPLGTPMAVVAIDHPQRIAFLVRERVQAWDVSYSELMGRACANLARRSLDMPTKLEELDVIAEHPVYRLAYDDYFNASRSLLGESLFRAAIQAAPDTEAFLMAVPNRDHLLLTRDGSREHLKRFQELVRWFHERQPAPISSLCFLLREEGVVGFQQGEG